MAIDIKRVTQETFILITQDLSHNNVTFHYDNIRHGKASRTAYLFLVIDTTAVSDLMLVMEIIANRHLEGTQYIISHDTNRVYIRVY